MTGKLLAYLGISKPLVRCDDNVIERRAPELVGRVLAGERIAFASDAGMPSVSDPGQVLVELARWQRRSGRGGSRPFCMCDGSGALRHPERPVLLRGLFAPQAR